MPLFNRFGTWLSTKYSDLCTWLSAKRSALCTWLSANPKNSTQESSSNAEEIENHQENNTMGTSNRIISVSGLEVNFESNMIYITSPEVRRALYEKLEPKSNLTHHTNQNLNDVIEVDQNVIYIKSPKVISALKSIQKKG
jgi:hypothetical protein